MTLTLESLAIRGGERTLCEGLSLTIGAGEIWAVLGENGAGKSSLLRTMAGLARPAFGSVRLDARPLDAWPSRARARRIAWMAQQDDEGFSASVLDSVLAARYPHLGAFARETQTDLRHVEERLIEVDLAGFADRLLWSLSGGERRRVALAAALMQDTPIRLLDEPLAALDPRHQSLVLELIRSSSGPERSTVFTTHDPNHALAIATHVLALNGESTLHGPAAGLLDARMLSLLYGCEMRLVESDDTRAFVIA